MVAGFYELHPMIVFAFGFLPLVAYHIKLFPAVRDGASQTAIDSVYYFGFIITISTLSVSVIAIATKGVSNDYMNVVYQFGLGLTATGYALFARMHLMSVSERMDDVDASELVDQYVSKVGHVVGQIEISAANFEAFSNSLVERTRQNTDVSFNAASAAVATAAKLFTEEFKQMMTDARGTVVELGNGIKGLNVESEIQELKSQIRSLGGILTSLSTRLTTFEKAADAVNEGVVNVSSTFDGLSQNINGTTAGLKELPGLASELVRIKQAFADIAKQAEALQLGVGQLESGFSRLIGEVDKSVSSVSDTLEGNSRKSAESVEKLTVHLTRLVDFIISETQKKSALQNESRG